MVYNAQTARPVDIKQTRQENRRTKHVFSFHL